MSARTHNRSIPPAASGIEIQLPWWAIALPAIAFAVLLVLLVSPADAHAASDSQPATQLVEWVHSVLVRLLP